jgi:hypothetical protein
MLPLELAGHTPGEVLHFFFHTNSLTRGTKRTASDLFAKTSKSPFDARRSFAVFF